MKRPPLRSLALVSLLVTLAAGCRGSGDRGADDEHREGGHGHASGAESPAAVKGPHGGRILEDGDFRIELAIHEAGTPPEYRAWLTRDGEPIDPAKVELTVELARFGGRTDVVRFAKRDDYLLGDRTVEEPHSFVVTVRAREGGRPHEWKYESFEGRTVISGVNAAEAGVRIEVAGPARIGNRLRAVGRVRANEERLARIVPRYPGTVREARKRVGDPVATNEIVAVVEASQTLQSYEVRSPIAGTVLARNVTAGEVAGGDPIYVVGDLSTVWIDLLLGSPDVARVRTGQSVEIAAGTDLRAESRIDYVAPIASEEGQAVVARAVVANDGAGWRPGLFATAEIVTDEIEVPVAVRSSALQKFRDWDVVFLNDGQVYQAMPVELGRGDREWVEIVSGVAAGQRYAAAGSFVVKADVEKSGATHEH